MPTQNDVLGTRLTIQALRNSAAANVLLNVPADTPLSPDFEDRTQNPSTTPPLMDQLKDNWEIFRQKAVLAAIATGLMKRSNNAGKQ